MNNFVCQKVEGTFSLWVKPKVYKVLRTRTGFIKNTKTGKNCGKIVYLYCHHYNSTGKRLKEPLYDDNCYEVIEEETENG